MRYYGYVISHGGYQRINNEDNAFLDGVYRKEDMKFYWEYETESENHLLAAVFDGMGGENDGEVASRIAARAIGKFKGQLSGNEDMYIRETNEEIQSYAGKNRMGTTYAAVSIESNQYYFQNIGDSRGYLFRNGELMQMTKDHNMVLQMRKLGILTDDQVSRHPDRHAIYQYLGIEKEEDVILEPHLAQKIKARKGDICLLCTDGLTDFVSDTEICDVLRKSIGLENKMEQLLSKALDKGGKDNVTILLIKTF